MDELKGKKEFARSLPIDIESKIEVPYVAYEGTIARFERSIKRLIISLVIAIALIFASNVAWLVFFDQFTAIEDVDDVSLENDEGNANYIGNNGVIENGEN